MVPGTNILADIASEYSVIQIFINLRGKLVFIFNGIVSDAFPGINYSR